MKIGDTCYILEKIRLTILGCDESNEDIIFVALNFYDKEHREYNIDFAPFHKDALEPYIKEFQTNMVVNPSIIKEGIAQYKQKRTYFTINPIALTGAFYEMVKIRGGTATGYLFPFMHMELN